MKKYMINRHRLINDVRIIYLQGYLNSTVSSMIGHVIVNDMINTEIRISSIIVMLGFIIKPSLII